jgi:hypothetical protein
MVSFGVFTSEMSNRRVPCLRNCEQLAAEREAAQAELAAERAHSANLDQRWTSGA